MRCLFENSTGKEGKLRFRIEVDEMVGYERDGLDTCFDNMGMELESFRNRP